MRAPADLIYAHGAALLRLLNAKDFMQREAAEREYNHIGNKIREFESLRKVGEVTNYAPLAGVDPRGFLR